MGTRLGRYEVIRTLAKGALTNLLLGRATGEAGFQRHVAIKQLREEHAQDPACLESFVNEARLAATLHHHNIVQVLDIGEDDGMPHFAMEYVHGVDLRKLLGYLGKRQEQLPLQHVVSIIAAAAAALHHAHEQRGADGAPLGIVHRQVTPANILVGFDGNVKIVDFGIAKAAIKRMQTGVGVLRGSAPYMAPEQCAGRTIDRRSDVFALGIVLYELATVRRLFKGENEFLTMSAVVNAEVPRPSQYRRDVPPDLEVVMLKALARDPLARYQTAHDMATALDRVARSVGAGGSNTALANYLKLQFGERKEPWLEGKVDQDPESPQIDFDGAASGLAPPPSEAIKSNAIPRNVAATKSSPINQARTIMINPSASATIPMDKSFSVATSVDDEPEPASSRVTTSLGEDDDEPDSKSTSPMPKHPGTVALKVPVAAEPRVGALPPTIALNVNPLAQTEPAAPSTKGAPTVSLKLPTNGAAAAPATVALKLPAGGVATSPSRAQHHRTAVANPPPPPEVVDERPSVREVKLTDATAIVEPLHMMVARAGTVTKERSRKVLYIGAGAVALLAVFLAIVFWPTAKTPTEAAAAPVAQADELAPANDDKPKSALDMTARDYEEARGGSGSAETGSAEGSAEAEKADAEKAAAEKAEAEKAEAEKAEAEKAEAKKAEAEKAEAEKAEAEKAEAEKAKAEKAKAEAEADTSDMSPAEKAAAAKAAAAKAAAEKAEAELAAVKADAAAKREAKKAAAEKAAAAKSAKRTTTKTTATKRTTTTTKKTTTKKKPKWDPDDLFLGE